jgi:cell division septation protein DedD
MRTWKWGVYAAAFAIGFVVGPLVIRHFAGLSGNASEHVERRGPVPRQTVTPIDVHPSAGSHRTQSGRSPQPGAARQADRVQPPRPPDRSATTSGSRPGPRVAGASALPPAPLQSPVAQPPAAVTSPQRAGPHAPSAPVTSEPGPATPPGDAAPPFVVTPAPDTAAPTGGDEQATPQETPRFHVQVGIFPSQEDAEALAERLHSLGYVATTVHDGDVYRVWVGAYFDRDTAERLAATMRTAGFKPVLVP